MQTIDYQLQPPADVLARFGIGWPMASMGPKAPFGLRPELLVPGGYLEFTKREMGHAYELGYRRMLRHRPLGEGVVGDRDMDMDSVWHLRESEYAFVEDDYRAATAWLRDQMPEVVVIDYFGTDEPDLRGLFEAGELPDHWARMFGSFEPAVGFGNVDIAMDAATRWRIAGDDRSIYAALAHALRAYKASQGRRVYIEALPRIGEPGKEWQHGFPARAIERFVYHKIRRDERNGRPWANRLHDPKAETIRWYTGHMRHQDWHVQWRPEHMVADCLLRPNSSPFVAHSIPWLDPPVEEISPQQWIDTALGVLRDAARRVVEKSGGVSSLSEWQDFVNRVHDELIGVE